MYTGRCFVGDGDGDGEGLIERQAPSGHRQRVFEGGSDVHSNRTRRYERHDEKFSRHRHLITELHASKHGWHLLCAGHCFRHWELAVNRTVGCEPLAVDGEGSRSVASLEDGVGLGW